MNILSSLANAALRAAAVAASPLLGITRMDAGMSVAGPNAAQRLVLSYYDGYGVNDRDYKAPHANRPTPKRAKRRPSSTPKLFKGHRV